MVLSNVAFSVFGLSVYWYGIVYSIGFLTTFLIFKKAKPINLPPEILENIFIIVFISSIVGARLFQILFYSFSYYLNHLSKIVYFWEGGMSIHGGLFGGIISVYFLSKKYKFNFLKLTDFLCIPLSLFLCLGRIANHLNQEMPGIITNQNWGIVFSKFDNFKRVPISLIESGKNLLIFNILLYLKYFKLNKLKTGHLSFIFLLLYNGIRFFLEFLKDTDKIFMIFSTEQIICFIFFVLTIIFFYLIKMGKINTMLKFNPEDN